MKMKLFTLLLTTLAFSSCITFYSGTTTSSAALSSNNYKYIAKGVQGTASVTQWLQIFAGYKHTLINDAKNNILTRYQLKDNQALANITVDLKDDLILGTLIKKTKCTITADIIEFNK